METSHCRASHPSPELLTAASASILQLRMVPREVLVQETSRRLYDRPTLMMYRAINGQHRTQDGNDLHYGGSPLQSEVSSLGPPTKSQKCTDLLSLLFSMIPHVFSLPLMTDGVDLENPYLSVTSLLPLWSQVPYVVVYVISSPCDCTVH